MLGRRRELGRFGLPMLAVRERKLVVAVAPAEPRAPVVQEPVLPPVSSPASSLLPPIVRMGIMSKLKALPGLARDTMAELEAHAGLLTDRLTAVKSKGAETFQKWHTELDAAEAVVKDAELAINQLSNGGPPLDGSPKPSGGG